MMRKMVYRGILVVLVAVFLFSGYKVASYYISAYTEGKVYDDLNQLVQNADKDKRPNDQSGSSGGSGSNEPLPPVYAESGRLSSPSMRNQQSPVTAFIPLLRASDIPLLLSCLTILMRLSFLEYSSKMCSVLSLLQSSTAISSILTFCWLNIESIHLRM